MTPPIIQTPRGSVVILPNGKAELKFNTNFQPKYQRRFTDAQVFVDSEVLRVCEPFTPLLTGMLIKSGQLGTVPGQGFVQWIAPYSRKRYYTPRKSPSTTGPLRGPFWFKNAMAVWKNAILAGAKTRAGGGK